MNDYIIVVVIN